MTTIDTVKVATNRIASAVIAEKLDYAGTSNFFETDQAITDTATLYMNVTTNVPNIKPTRFKLTEVKFYMNPTNAVTYRLYLLEGPTADDVTQASDVVFDSGAAKADSTEYIYREGCTGSWAGLTTVDGTLPIIVDLHIAGRLYYMVDWSGAPGDTPGYIKCRGKLMK